MDLFQQILGIAGGLTGLVLLIWGAAKRQQGRESVDEQLAAKHKVLEAASSKHETNCDDRHDSTRTKLEEITSAQQAIQIRAEHTRERVAKLEKKLDDL